MRDRNQHRQAPRSLRIRLLAVMAAIGLTLSAAIVATPAAAQDLSVQVKPGQLKRVSLSTEAAVSSEGALTFSLPKLPASGSGFYSAVRLRSSSSGAYEVQTRVYPSGAVSVTIKRSLGSGSTVTQSTIGSALRLPVALKAGQSLTISGSVTGTNAVKVAASVSVDGGKPVTLTATDSSSARLTKAGAAEGTFYTSSSTPAVNVSYSVGAPESVEEVPAPAPAPAPAPEPAPEAEPGFPSAATTGVPKGTSLKVHNGDIRVTKANTVIEGLEVRGTITIAASGVVIKNSKIVGGPEAKSAGLVNNVASGKSFSVVDSEIYAAYPSHLWNGVMGSNFTLDGVNIHDVIDPVRVLGSNVTVRNSWLHDNTHYESDPAWNGGSSHDDSVQIQAGGNIVIENNRLEGADNAAIQITQDRSRTALGTITVRSNYLNDGGCTVNVAKTPSPFTMRLTDNVFGPDRKWGHCALIAPAANPPIMSGNVWEATGKTMASFTPAP